MFQLTEDQAHALREFLGANWSQFVSESNLTEGEAEALYEAVGGEN